jgi:hypothetical protein
MPDNNRMEPTGAKNPPAAQAERFMLGRRKFVGTYPALYRFSPKRNFIDPLPQPRNIYRKKKFFFSVKDCQPVLHC